MNTTRTTTAPDGKILRSFGLIVGGMFGGIALWQLLRHRDIAAWAVTLSIALVAPALVAPRVLATPYRIWMAVGRVLGAFNTRLILGTLFYGMVTPIGAIARAAGHDPMARRFDPSLDTYKILVEPRAAKHLDRQF